MQSSAKRDAQEKLKEAKELINLAKTEYTRKDGGLAESLCRDSLKRLREASLLEPSEPTHRRQLHDVGRMVHDTFGCQLKFREGSYWINCPVILSHVQIGFSIGGSADVICTICGQDNLTCPHVKGRRYDNVVASRRLEFCNICLKKNCAHELGQVHNDVEAFGIVTNIELDHVAIVRNPADPLCVIESRTVDEEELKLLLPAEGLENFVYGQTVVDCHHCRLCTE
jgi:hypothetical protein